MAADTTHPSSNTSGAAELASARRRLVDGSVAQALESAPASDIVRWAAATFGSGITFATGFGVEGCVLIDLMSQAGARIDLCTLDTGVLFPQTYALWKNLETRYQVTIRGVLPELTLEQQALQMGAALWKTDPDRCCEVRKVRPLRQALAPFDAWVTAIRREQSAARKNAAVVEWDEKFGLWKVNPLVTWSTKDVWDYVHKHDVPYNPLHNEGYPSIGCEPCTSPVQPGEDARAGRWRGRGKNECGLHTPAADSSGVHAGSTGAAGGGAATNASGRTNSPTAPASESRAVVSVSTSSL